MEDAIRDAIGDAIEEAIEDVIGEGIEDVSPPSSPRSPSPTPPQPDRRDSAASFSQQAAAVPEEHRPGVELWRAQHPGESLPYVISEQRTPAQPWEPDVVLAEPIRLLRPTKDEPSGRWWAQSLIARENLPVDWNLMFSGLDRWIYPLDGSDEEFLRNAGQAASQGPYPRLEYFTLAPSRQAKLPPETFKRPIPANINVVIRTVVRWPDGYHSPGGEPNPYRPSIPLCFSETCFGSLEFAKHQFDAYLQTFCLNKVEIAPYKGNPDRLEAITYYCHVRKQRGWVELRKVCYAGHDQSSTNVWVILDYLRPVPARVSQEPTIDWFIHVTVEGWFEGNGTAALVAQAMAEGYYQVTDDDHKPVKAWQAESNDNVWRFETVREEYVKDQGQWIHQQTWGWVDVVPCTIFPKPAPPLPQPNQQGGLGVVDNRVSDLAHGEVVADSTDKMSEKARGKQPVAQCHTMTPADGITSPSPP